MARRSPAKTSPAPRKRRPGRPPRHPTDTESRFPGARVIKRYGNRRLYDAQLRRSVTMHEIAEMVRKNDDVRVLDGDTGEDITKRVLTQIILEEQNARQLELLPVELLRKLIAVRSEPLSSWLEQYLNAGAQFLERQMSASAPATRAMKESFASLFPWMKPETWMPVEVEGEPAPDAEDSASLRSQMEELERRLADLTARMKRR